jgi:NitT/TauT family transport system permease protein
MGIPAFGSKPVLPDGEGLRLTTPGSSEGGGSPAPAVEGASRVRLLLIRRRNTLLSILAVLVVAGAWQAFAGLGWINTQLNSSPWGVFSAFREMVANGTLGSALLVSAKLFGVGLGIAILIGVVGGILIGSSPIVGALTEPFVAMLYAMPVVALLPVILAWFGITFEAQVVMVVLIAVFPILVSAITGTRQVDPQLLRLARSLRASQLQVMRTIVLPSLVPYLVAGIRLSVGGALIGMVVAEYFLGQAGIGGQIVQAGEVLKIDQVFVDLFILAFASVFISSVLKAAERRLTRWR